MRLLLFNLATDEADPVLGFGSVWISELARHCESIDVITMYRGAVDLPNTVRVFSAGREHGWSKARRLAQFYRHLTRLLSAHRYDVCFAHMMPHLRCTGWTVLESARRSVGACGTRIARRRGNCDWAWRCPGAR